MMLLAGCFYIYDGPGLMSLEGSRSSVLDHLNVIIIKTGSDDVKADTLLVHSAKIYSLQSLFLCFASP